MKNLYLFLFVACLFQQPLKSQSEIWGLTSSGADGFGTIYGLPTGSTGIATQYNLTGNPGSSPQYSKLLQTTPNGKLYGMTNTGGASNAGVIFEYDTLTNAYSRKVDFGGTLGANPRGALIQAQNGKLYGMTQLGGASSLGVIFEYDISTGTYTKKVDFTGNTGTAPGSQPYGTLIDANPGSGKLYGMTRFGGVNGLGVLFEYDYILNTYAVKVDFNGNVGSSLGANPFGQLIKAGTNLYGLSSAGGSNNVGTLFEYDYTNNVFTKKIDLATSTGSGPQGSLLLASNGLLYGMTVSGGSGLPTAAGVIFSYSIGTNTYTKLTDLGSGVGSGANPTGELMQGTNGKLYAMTRLGGANNVGAIFEYDLTGPTYTKKVDLASTAAVGGAPFGSLMQVSTGKIYGMTSNGGNSGGGVIFNYVISSATYTKKIDLNTSNGGNPNGHLVQASNGLLYGLASVGGTNNVGVIFEYDKTTNIYTKKIDLLSTNGITPFGSMVQASNGKLYGLTSAGGTSGLGTLFEYDITSNTYTKRVDLTGNAGTNPGSVPYGSLVQFSGNGKLYGMTKQGGTNTQGVIFEFDPTSNTYTKKIDMLAATGYSAFGTMVESSGKLYGMTQLGGVNAIGVIFEYDPTTNTYTKKIDFTGNTGAAPGSQPFGSLVSTSTVGILYGMTKLGGANGQGVIFEYNVSSNTYTSKYDLSTSNGSQPLGSLIRAANDNLYGVTNIGGANSLGALFEYNITTATYTKKYDFTASSGNLPAYTQLLEVCTKPTTPGSITSSTNALCQGNSSTKNFSISAVANATAYAWTMPSGTSTISGATSNNFAANLGGVSAGTYTYGVGGVNICGTGTLSINTITVHALPTVNVNSGSFCSGKSFTIIPGGASTYTVQGGSLVVSPTSNSTYTVAGTSALGCVSSNTATSSVTVNALPTVGANSGPICLGSSFTIIPTGVVTSTVSGGSLIVSPTTNTTYAVTGTDANGCVSSNTAISSVTVNSLPVIGVNNGTICAGLNHTFIPTGASTYTIQGGSFVVSPPTSSSYTVTGTSTAGCISAFPATGNVTVFALPVITINSGTICAGTNYTFTPGGASTYTIQGGSMVVSPASNSTYAVVGTSSAGCLCALPSVGNVTVFALPIIGINSGTICLGNTHTFVPTGASIYTITGGTYIVSPSVTTNYSVTGTSSLGCVSSSPAVGTVTVYSLPTVSVNSGTICLGKTFTIVPTGAGSGANYTVSPGGSTLVSPTVDSNYSVTATNSLGCVSAIAAISTVSVISLPTISATSGAVCLGSIFTTTVGGASTYTYMSSTNTINATGSIPLNISSTTIFSVTGKSAVGCQAANPALMTVTVNPLPPVTVSGPTAICVGESATLTASGANTYNWGTSSNATIVVNPLSSTTFSVLGTDLNNCSQMTPYFLNVNPLPTITVISGAICPGNSYTLTPSGAVSYTYSSGSNVVSPTSTTNYSVTGTSSLGCVAAQSAVATVSVVNVLTVTVSGITNICVGSSASLTANGASTYSWNTGDQNNAVVLSPIVSTNYTVIGTSGTCQDSAYVTVTVNSLPNILVSSSSSVICLNESISLLTTGAVTYTWSTQQMGSTIVVSPTVSTVYSVSGTDLNGCINNTTYNLQVNECVGIAKTSAETRLFKLYPNPNEGEFYIETDSEYYVTVLNALGQPVLTQKLHEGKNALEIHEMAKGLYFLKYKDGTAEKTVKIVKQ